jgi:hypothetical protein
MSKKERKKFRTQACLFGRDLLTDLIDVYNASQEDSKNQIEKDIWSDPVEPSIETIESYDSDAVQEM